MRDILWISPMLDYLVQRLVWVLTAVILIEELISDQLWFQILFDSFLLSDLLIKDNGLSVAPGRVIYR